MIKIEIGWTFISLSLASPIGNMHIQGWREVLLLVAYKGCQEMGRKESIITKLYSAQLAYKSC